MHPTATISVSAGTCVLIVASELVEHHRTWLSSTSEGWLGPSFMKVYNKNVQVHFGVVETQPAKHSQRVKPREMSDATSHEHNNTLQPLKNADDSYTVYTVLWLSYEHLHTSGWLELKHGTRHTWHKWNGIKTGPLILKSRFPRRMSDATWAHKVMQETPFHKNLPVHEVEV